MDMLASSGGGKNTITIAGMVISTAGLKNLSGFSNAANYVTCLRQPNGNSGYQVPVGKKFVIRGVRGSIHTPGSAGQVTFGVGYGDNDTGAAPGSTLPTNGVYFIGGVAFPIPLQSAAGSIIETALPQGFEVPAGKYVYMRGSGGADIATWQIFGYEENA